MVGEFKWNRGQNTEIIEGICSGSKDREQTLITQALGSWRTRQERERIQEKAKGSQRGPEIPDPMFALMKMS